MAMDGIPTGEDGGTDAAHPLIHRAVTRQTRTGPERTAIVTHAAEPDTPACVLFTSGSTGKPKAVVSPHRATTRLFGPAGIAGCGPGSVGTQSAPCARDRSRDPLLVARTPAQRLAPHLVPDTVRTAGRFPVGADGKVDEAALLVSLSP
jgi:D-alanine--poly(phosphoribitol) ligase subunit 1